jgi:glycosyltransferase involved in cell wall biosynthesis
MLDYSVAVFAYNIASKVELCVESIIKSNNKNLNIYILANGCTDSTLEIGNKLQKKYSFLHVVNLSVADKSNAWNFYVHQIAPKANLHFFIDGDVQVLPNSLESISQQMAKDLSVNAIGGVPFVGRDKIGWINRMFTFGRVSGGLYALNERFINEIREQQVLLPIGFIGEDFLVSAIAKNIKSLKSLNFPSPLLIINKSAGFTFKQLSKKSLFDYYLYFRRLVSYRIRDYQLSMLIQYCDRNPTNSFPSTVSE